MDSKEFFKKCLVVLGIVLGIGFGLLIVFGVSPTAAFVMVLLAGFYLTVAWLFLFSIAAGVAILLKFIQQRRAKTGPTSS